MSSHWKHRRRRHSSYAGSRCLEGRVNRVATERGVLFDKAAGSFGLSALIGSDYMRSNANSTRCVLSRRQQRATPTASTATCPWCGAPARLVERVTVRNRKTKPERHAEAAEPDTAAAARQRRESGPVPTSSRPA
jgi:hypothetical protein